MAESTSGNYDTHPRDPGGEVSLWHVVPSNNAPYLGYMYEKHVLRTGVTVIKKRRGWVAYPNLAAGAGSRDY